MESFAVVMARDYKNCHIDPAEMFAKVGREYINVVQDDHREKSFKGQKKLWKNLAKIGRKRRSAVEMILENSEEVQDDETERFRRAPITTKVASKTAKLAAKPFKYVLKDKLPGVALPGFGKRKRSIPNDKTSNDVKLDQKRKQRSAFEMLMGNIEEVRAKRDADLDLDGTKRRRRSTVEMSMGNKRNSEF